MSKKRRIILASLIIILIGGGGFFLFKESDKVAMVANSISIAKNVINLLPIKEDTKKEVQTIDALVSEFTKKNGIEKRFLLLLQNNMELRPGGGFLGQYAVLKIKDGEVTGLTFEDANLLDQRITAKVAAPYPFEKMMSLKKWKFRDSNFSPDYPTNVEKAKYFYRLAGGNNNFDGVIAVNATTFERAFGLTGPIDINGVELNSGNAVLKLEEIVEKKYLLNEDIDTQHRKDVMKNLAVQMTEKLTSLNNISKLSSFVLGELRNKDVMLNFVDENLQRQIRDVHWDGGVTTDWGGDYFMMVDANMGALKSDYYIKRNIEYNVDLTGEKPIADVFITYKHTATYGDWRTSDYHSYLRIYAPKGATLLEREMVSYPLVDEDFDKSYFGFTLHVLINRETKVRLKYELPESVRQGDYKLLMQKQSGVGEVPIKVKVKTKDGEFTKEDTLKKDLKFQVGESTE
ncbi:MAG: hypothetical protein ACD_7C00497G0005 [uncultured bacterium]|nr:MAG: hypothetical protein ACD_7C00497G0005 [uncultured bacterium]HBR79116.1 hypothetical protein [Candidatus Moranbacteria bacterium]